MLLNDIQKRTLNYSEEEIAKITIKIIEQSTKGYWNLELEYDIDKIDSKLLNGILSFLKTEGFNVKLIKDNMLVRYIIQIDWYYPEVKELYKNLIKKC